MKLITLSLLSFFASTVHAKPCEALPPSSVDQLDTNIVIPNCLQPRALSLAANPQRLKKNRLTDNLCNCRSLFEQRLDPEHKPLPTLTKDQKQQLFFDSLFNEYEKVQRNNLVDIAKMNGLDPQGSLTFKASIKACSFKTVKSFTSECSSPKAQELFNNSPLVKSYGQRLSNELINIMGPIKAQPRQGLLNRETLFKIHSQNQCNLNEHDTLKYSNSALESIIAPEFIKRLNQHKNQLLNKSLDEIFETFGQKSSLKDILRQHPLIAPHMGTGEQFLRLITSVSDPFTKESLHQTLSSPENAQIIDSKLAHNCGESFRELKKSLCSPQFEEGDIELDPFGNLSKLGIKIPSATPPFADSEELITLNKQVLQFCPWSNNPEALNLTQSSNPIDSLLDSNYRGVSNNEYSSLKYQNEISSVRDQICGMKDETKPCASYDELTMQQTCLAAQLWRESQTNPGSSSEALAQRPIAELIRGMLPPLESLDMPTKNELARIGIIPLSTAQRPTGAQVAQAATQVERFNPQFTSAANATIPQVTAFSGAPTQAHSQTAIVQPRTPAAAAQRSPYSAQLAEVMSQKQKMFEESNDTYRGIIDQLIKRRMDNPSREEVTKAVNEEFRQASKPFNPNSREGQSFINNIVQNYPQAQRQNNPQVISRPFEQERVSQILDESIADTNASRNAGITNAPTRAGANSSASSLKVSTTSGIAGLTKVVVNDPSLDITDPQLAQLLQTALTMNDNGEVLEKMLKQRKDFILKINSAEVKMDYDPLAQNYRIEPIGNVSGAVLKSLNRFITEYGLIDNIRRQGHRSLQGLVQELRNAQLSL